jgi:hypothetical protein
MQARLKRQGYRPDKAPPVRDVDHTFDPATSVRFRGGARIGRVNASAPLVVLSIDREWAHLSGIRPLWIDRRDVLAVRTITTTLPPGDNGLRFATDDGALDGVIFWTTKAPAVSEALARLGWPVDSN